MPPEEHAALVAELFKAAVEMTPQDRPAFLDDRCGSDVELRAEVESLLRTQDRAGQFMERAAMQVAARATVDDTEMRTGQSAGDYEILSLIGKGGMGEVYLAHDRQLGRRVALKLVRRGMDSDDIVRRFQHEQRLLASLNHPNIAQLHDAGVTEDGIPFFAMEYVEGIRIDDYCREKKLSVEQQLALFGKVCAAVQYAHQHLVVHRDIKPSNILVTAEGEPKLLDFGIAKLLDTASGDALEQTITLQNVMTPEYASPEQVSGRPITTASDVYSLGVLLYELLTGSKPYKIHTRTPAEIARIVAEKEPTKPSLAINPELKVQNPKSLRGDLDNIVLMALRKEPDRRYTSVAQFSADVRRHLDALPVIARKDTLAYRSSRFVARHRVSVAAAFFILLTLIGAIVATSRQARIARTQRDVARAAQAKAERISQFLSAALSYSDPSAAVADTKNRRDATISQMLDDIAPRIEAELADQPEVRASLQRTAGLAYSSQLRFVEAERYLRAALQTQLQIYGEGHQEIALTLSGLAIVQESKGDVAGAEESLQKAIAIFHNQPPKDQTQAKALANTLCQLGDHMWSKGDFQATESAFAEAFSVASQLQGGDREPLADATFGLGVTRYAQGRLDEATTLLRSCLDEYRRLPHTRWKWSNALNSLGQALYWKNEFDESIANLQESGAISREIWGENNQLYARALWLEVYALCFKGDCAAAEEPLRRAEEIYDRIMPDNKGFKANMYDARNLFLTRTGRAREGEPFGRQAIELYQSVMNRGVPSITLARINLAENLIAQQKYSEAEQILLEAYKDASEMQGAQHWRTLAAARALAKFYDMRNQPNSAAKYRALSSTG